MPRVTIYHNVALTRRYGELAPAIFAEHPSGYVKGDTVATAFAYVDERADIDEAAACNRAFELGNIDPSMTSDPTLVALVNEYRRERVRSVSVGDVISVDGHAFAVASFGFDDLGTAAGMEFAGGRTAREIREAIDMLEKNPTQVDDATKAFIETLVR